MKKVKINTIIALTGDNKDLDGLKVQAYFVKDDEDQSNNQWHSIENQKYSAENSVGGKIEITKVETEKDSVAFYFTKSGFIDEGNSMIYIRNKGKSDYITPNMIEKISGNECKATFAIEENTDDEEDNEEYTILTNVEDSEFSILGSAQIQIVGEGIEI